MTLGQMNQARLLIFFGMLFVVGPVSNAADVTFFDGDFAASEWTLVERHYLAADTEIRRFVIGGNPDVFLSVENTGGHRDSQTHAFYFKDGATYDPAVLGAISQIDYSEDSRFLSNQGFTDSRVQAFSLGIRQTGATYFVPNRGSSHLTNSTTEWITTPLSYLSAEEFWLVDEVGNVDVNMHPDFSVTGDEIQFGFFRGNSAGGSTSYSIESAIDNWTVSVQTTAVPEPSSVFALVSACGAVFLRRKKRSK